MNGTQYQLKTIECSGSPEAMGHAHGEQLKSEITGFVAQRFEALEVYMRERNQLDIDGFLEVGKRCLASAQSWDPAGTAELMAIAEAAQVDPVRLYAAGNMTDVRDVVLLGSGPKDDEGCSALVVPKGLAKEGTLLAAQTWDLNPTDIDYVVAVRRKPTCGVETWSITCVGCLSLMGMNAEGLTVGTTNIKAKETRPGVGYLSLLHRALSARSLGEAQSAIREAPRAAAHTYWLADAHGGVELECSALRAIERPLGEQPLTRTNHCLAPALVPLQGEPTSPSSEQRLLRLSAWLSQGEQTVVSIQQLFSDRSDGLNSVNRYLEDGTGTSTNACMVAVPERRELWGCRGPADRGAWVKLQFS